MYPVRISIYLSSAVPVMSDDEPFVSKTSCVVVFCLEKELIIRTNPMTDKIPKSETAIMLRLFRRLSCFGIRKSDHPSYPAYLARIESVVNDVEILIHSSKDTDEIKQKELELKYDKLIQKLKDLEHQKEEVMDKRNKINTFISTLKDKVDVISEFDEELFNIMVDKAVVHRDKSIEFIFNSGYKVKVKARK